MDQNIRICYLTCLVLILSMGMMAQTILVPEGATWKYLDNGSNQGTAWREPSFNDDSWAAGPAELGYGDGDETTVLSYGPNSSNKYITYYFRHNFDAEEANITSNLLLRVQRDDGVVVYINGTEVCRSNMPAGTINYQTLASSAVGGTDESTFYEYLIPSDELLNGDNVIAAEIHQSGVTSTDISFDLELSTSSHFRKAPYLVYNGDNTQMMLLWQLFENYPSVLAWGSDPDYSLGNLQVDEYGPDHQHNYTITSLVPSTKYYYRVVTQSDTITGDFRTAPDQDANEVTIYAYGDTRSYPADHDSVAKRMVQDYGLDPVTQTIALSAGDLVSDGNVESNWDSQFFSPDYPDIRELFRTVSVLNCKGNHEGTGLLFKKYFPYPYQTTGGFYWSFDYGPVHICVVDQYSSYSPGSDQYNWITSDLASSSKLWKFFLFHEPGWSAGDGHENNVTVQNVLQPLCLEYGVQFVFAGHNHYYSRAEVSGIEHITTGGGGAPLHDPNPAYPNIVATSSSHHFCKMHIDMDTLHFSAIRDDGTLIESFEYYNFYEWTGASDSDWNNPGNWSNSLVPGAAWNVLIPGDLTNYPQITGSGTCRNLTIESGSMLTIPDGGSLDIKGHLENQGILDILEGGYVIER